MSKSYLVWLLLGACIGLVACDDDPAPANNGSILNLCEKTGGTLNGNDCVCAGETCKDVKWCDSNGKCSTDAELTPDLLCVASGGQAKNNKCECDAVECDEGVICNLTTKKCASAPANPGQVTFADLCIHSGGTVMGDKCKCGDETCEKDKICDGNNKCSKNTADQPATYCVNDDNYVGWLYTCTGADCQKTKCEIDSNGTKLAVSCNGNQCGDCMNYVTACENNMEHNALGEIYACREGKKVLVKACDEDYLRSCVKKTCKDISCTDELLCGECLEGSFKCENGNVPEDTVFLNYRGEMIKIPQGFITGFRSKCVNGQWTKLKLDDAENCFYGHLEPDDPAWPSTELNGKKIITVYGYDSRGRHEGTEYALSMCAEDGIHCGECLYSFSYCSNGTMLSCRRGRVEQDKCPDNECATSNTCFTPSVSAYCNGYQCQNCKSICNWQK